MMRTFSLGTLLAIVGVVAVAETFQPVNIEDLISKAQQAAATKDLSSKRFFRELRTEYRKETGIPLTPALFESDSRFRKNFAAEAAVQKRGSRPFLIGGSNAAPDEFKDTVAILDDTGSVYCSGLVIDATRVLTAEHCLAEAVFVVQGQFVDSPAVKVPVLNRAKNGDVGLIFVTGGLADDSVAFATAANIDDANVKSTVVAGFGRTATTNGGFRQFAKMQLISRECSSAGDSKRYGCKAGEMVAGKETQAGENTCQGDSGGPSYVIPAQTKLLAAIVKQNATSSVPCANGSVFIRVDGLENWIRNARP